jgi:PKD repeat protein
MSATASAQSASFDYSPAPPLTGQTVTFTSTSDPGVVTWDFDGDDICTEPGNVVTHTFPTAGSYPVTLCLNGGTSRAVQTIIVLNRPPVALFTVVPGTPVAGEQVTFTSVSTDADGPIVAYQWDLDGDGVFDDGTQETALHMWRRAGSYPVALRVVDRDGATDVVQAVVLVAKKPVGVFSRAPLVRIVGQPTATGARLNLVTVSSPKGAHVGVRCKGHGCPYKRKRFTSKGKRVNLRKLAGTYRAGAVIEVRVTKSNTIGKFTRIRIRAGKNPARIDCSIQPGKPNKPTGCQS